ncbi:hypothetical protein SPO1998 [Ruegeria pomeroyi DSS-3]|uniref:Uncharacterized protein n=2 Tax=Ruegeria pomeroyi TaxID=89184 RepID=Q5LRX3_RUEPO|nr:hypothetical protein SPO1998 [Ruegeria pomeroyi DSS-3]NVK99563.1 hypothetical protein [Ruegeria pomeroyi]
MSSKPASTIAGWLQLNELTAGQCETLLKLAPRSLPGTGQDRQVPSPDGPALWALAADCLSETLPELASDILRTASQTRVDFAPDPRNYPRPFTLHMPVDGQVYVSCPLAGTPWDALTVAHEFGHALQLNCCSGVQLPPVLRETAAFVAEAVVAGALALRDTPLADPVCRAYARRTLTDLGPIAKRLRAALACPDTPYDDCWNYPPARQIAQALTQGDRPLRTGIAASVFRGDAQLGALVSLLCSDAE